MKIWTMAFAVLGGGAIAQAAPVIDGVISIGEWNGATTAIIGNGGGTAYFFADTSYIYGAFDITGWTSAMGPASGGNLLGFGVWNADDSYPGDGVEFQQATSKANWGGDGDSGTMNGLVSAFRIDAQSPPAASIPGDLQAMDSFATGHRVWEVKMPICSMAIVDLTVWVVGGINFDRKQHWYGAPWADPFVGYIPVPVVDPCAPSCGKNGDKVQVCHKQGKQPKTICVNQSEVQTHLDHGDTCGPCGGPCA